MHSYFYYVLNSTIDRSEYRKNRAVFLNDYKKFILDNIDIYQYDDFLEKNRKDILNLITSEEFLKYE